LFSIISHQLFAPPGQISFPLLVAAAFLASFILMIDSYMVLRSGWNLQGIEELKRGGIDISGGASARIKAAVFLTIRIILSIGIAQLTAIFLSFLIFGSDITARLQQTYLQNNAALIDTSTTLVDAKIRRAADAVKTETAQEVALAAQVTVLRQNQIDPSAGDPQIQVTQQEMVQLLAQKAAADQAVQQAETFASDELGGIKGSPDNSGVPGSGPRRAAALEAEANAKEQDQQIGAELQAAQTRLDALRSQSVVGDKSTEQEAKVKLPAYETTLAAEDAKLASMKNTLTAQEDHRDDAIRAAVGASPNYVPYNDGLLTQITVLDQIAQQNRKIAAVIILVDVTSFGFELAAVLAKVTSYVPTTYAALLARSAYMQVVRLVDEMMEELNAPAKAPSSGIQIIPPVIPPHKERGESLRPEREADPFTNSLGPLSAPQKRRRGRPRKVPPAA
jgi:hypothetical protein